MPRSGRGGARQGTVGTAYGNRTDLNSSMPVETATNQPYGAASEQQAAQRAIPVAGIQTPGVQPTPTPQAQPAQPVAQAQAQGPLSDQMPALPQQYPGELRWLHPTDHPDEPITAGIDMGPGAGSEATAGPPMPITNELARLASHPQASSMLMDMVHAAAVLGL